MKNPIIFTFNIRQSVFTHLGLNSFQHLASYHDVHLLPIITTHVDTIESRAKKISQKLPELLGKLGKEKAHLVSYSCSGIDTRFALNENYMDQHCVTLTTISTPNKGSRLAALSDRGFMKDDKIDHICRLLGVGLKPFHEFVPENIKCFNDCVPERSNIDVLMQLSEYYSIGSERLPNACTPSLQESGHYLQYKTEYNYNFCNDGVFCHDEFAWGEHLVNFEADHGEVIGLFGGKRTKTMKLVQEIVQDWEKLQESG